VEAIKKLMKPKDFVARLYILGGKDIVGPSD
jgi:hypothetical protein